MKKHINLLFIVIFLLSSASCSDKSDKGENNDKKKLDDIKSEYLSEYAINKILKTRSDEIISLLSIKYHLTKELTRKIINEFEEDYLSLIIKTKEDNYYSLISKAETIEELERLKTEYEKTSDSVEERIKNISTENNIEQSVIASLLIDYKIWYEAQHDETY